MIWRDVPGYAGQYQVAADGRVFSCKSAKTLRPRQTKAGYLQVTLSRNGRLEYPLIHRLVAAAFIPNPENKPQVNHKNGVKADNRAQNLEWVTGSENHKHRYDVLGQRGGRSKPVVCTETGTAYPSAKAAAAALGLDRSCVTMCCLGTRNKTGNLHFKFLEE